MLAPLEHEQERLLAILDLIEESRRPAERADLAVELVGTCARCEDVKARAVYPAIEELAGEHHEIERARADQEVVREGLGEIRRRTRHVKPGNVYADDPEGFEAALEALLEAIRQHLEQEEAELLPQLARLDVGRAATVRDEVERSVEHALSHPSAHRNPLARSVLVLGEKLDRVVKDQSTPWRPGVEHLEERLSRHREVGKGEIEEGPR